MTSLAPILAVTLDRVSPQVTQWPQRLLLTVILVVVVGLAVFGMWWGWRSRGRRQSDIADPAQPPVELGPVLAQAEGRYVGASRAGDWLDRVVVHSLGVPSRAGVSVHPTGVLIARTGAPEIFLPVADLTSVRTDRGVAGSVVERDGMIVFGWHIGGAELECGFRGDHTAAHASVLNAAAGLLVATTGRPAAQTEGDPR